MRTLSRVWHAKRQTFSTVCAAWRWFDCHRLGRHAWQFNPADRLLNHCDRHRWSESCLSIDSGSIVDLTSTDSNVYVAFPNVSVTSWSLDGTPNTDAKNTNRHALRHQRQSLCTADPLHVQNALPRYARKRDKRCDSTLDVIEDDLEEN